MEVKGKIRFIGEMTSVTSSFQKRELVVTTDEQYPQHILIEFTQDKCDLLNNYRVNQEVSVSINLRGREWVNPQGETRYFNSIQGWRISSVQPAQNATSAPPVHTPPSPMPAQQTFTPAVNEDLYGEEDDDIPF
jgi:hypothetical protein